MTGMRYRYDSGHVVYVTGMRCIAAGMQHPEALRMRTCAKKHLTTDKLYASSTYVGTQHDDGHALLQRCMPQHTTSFVLCKVSGRSRGRAR